ncbi:hypothetical protein TRIUR3_20433 [Triticum urartu]|uniref:Uncharacterized protein n=1 Tax=Triticum urartu TaxID=4572 RepID=M7ZLU5_TRIUA|nr:hypothetical protein TRIUR3_20433 [Triticum urartu]
MTTRGTVGDCRRLRDGVRGEVRLPPRIIGVNQLPKLKEISLGSCGRVAKLALLQSEVDAHPNSPVLRLSEERRSHHDLGGILVQLGEATGESSSLRPEPAAAGESSRSQAVGMATANIRSAQLIASLSFN